MSENYSATCPAEEAGLFFTQTAVKTPENIPHADIVRDAFLLQNFKRKGGDPMKDTRAVPEMYRWNVRKLAAMLCTDVETAYAMILLTASFMDLRPDDPKVTEMILNDCCMEV